MTNEISEYTHQAEIVGMDEVTGKLIATVQNQDFIRDLNLLDITMDSTDMQILEAIRSPIREELGVDIRDESGSWLYKVIKVLDKSNIHCIPNSTAGV